MTCTGCRESVIQRIDGYMRVYCRLLRAVQPHKLEFCSLYDPTSHVEAWHARSATYPLMIDPRPSPPSVEKGYV